MGTKKKKGTKVHLDAFLGVPPSGDSHPLFVSWPEKQASEKLSCFDAVKFKSRTVGQGKSESETDPLKLSTLEQTWISEYVDVPISEAEAIAIEESLQALKTGESLC
jgi:hypothetical protein